MYMTAKRHVFNSYIIYYTCEIFHIFITILKYRSIEFKIDCKNNCYIAVHSFITRVKVVRHYLQE